MIHTCKICNYNTNYKYNLKKHLTTRKHRKNVINKCNSVFIQIINDYRLKNNINIFKNTKPYYKVKKFNTISTQTDLSNYIQINHINHINHINIENSFIENKNNQDDNGYLCDYYDSDRMNKYHYKMKKRRNRKKKIFIYKKKVTVIFVILLLYYYHKHKHKKNIQTVLPIITNKKESKPAPIYPVFKELWESEKKSVLLK